MALMKVSYSDLEEAFLLVSYDRHFWLDRQTGRILAYCSEAAEALEEGDVSDLPDWMADDIYESLRRRDYIQEWARDEGVELDLSRGDV